MELVPSTVACCFPPEAGTLIQMWIPALKEDHKRGPGPPSKVTDKLKMQGYACIHVYAHHTVHEA